MSDHNSVLSTPSSDADFENVLETARPVGASSADETFVQQGGLSPQISTQTLPGTLSHERAAFYASHPYPAFHASLTRRLTPEQSFITKVRRFFGTAWDKLQSGWPRYALAGSMTAVLLFLVAPKIIDNETKLEQLSPTQAPPLQGRPDSIRSKGKYERPKNTALTPTPDVRLQALLRTLETARPLNDGEMLRAGDQIRFSYDSGGLPYILVVSVDDRGVITPLYPDDGSESMEIVPGINIPLPGSIQLDDFVGTERIFALFSAKPLPLLAVQSAVQQLPPNAGDQKINLVQIDQLPLPKEIAQTSLWFRKLSD